MGDNALADSLMDQLRTFIKDELRTVRETLEVSLLDKIEKKKEPEGERSQEQKIAKMTPEVFQDLANRGGAISAEVKNKVTDLVLDGKTESEVLRFLTDEMTKTAGTKMEVKDGDGTGRNEPKKKELDNKGPVRSFEGVEDQEFYDAIMNTPYFGN